MISLALVLAPRTGRSAPPPDGENLEQIAASASVDP